MRRSATLVLVALLVIATGLVAAGCKSASDKVGEAVAKKALDANGVKVKGDGKDGAIEVTGKDGKKSSLSYGTDLPKDFPSDVPMPDGAKIVSATKVASSKDGDNYVVVAKVKKSADEVLAFYKDKLTGYTEKFVSTSGNTGAATYAGSEHDVSVTISKQSGDNDLTVTVTPHTPGS